LSSPLFDGIREGRGVYGKNYKEKFFFRKKSLKKEAHMKERQYNTLNVSIGDFDTDGRFSGGTGVINRSKDR